MTAHRPLALLLLALLACNTATPEPGPPQEYRVKDKPLLLCEFFGDLEDARAARARGATELPRGRHPMWVVEPGSAVEVLGDPVSCGAKDAMVQVRAPGHTPGPDGPMRITVPAAIGWVHPAGLAPDPCAARPSK